jgi:hypothetical protein
MGEGLFASSRRWVLDIESILLSECSSAVLHVMWRELLPVSSPVSAEVSDNAMHSWHTHQQVS